MKISSKTGKLTVFITKYLAFIFFSLLRVTFKYRIIGHEFKGERCIYLLWHQNIISLLLNRVYENVAIVVSASFDGELISAPAKMLGYLTVRGSSSKKGISALREMLVLAKKHAIAITPDGPKGPKYQCKDGAFFLAYMTKLPIVPVSVKVNRKWQFNSWDKFIFPKPFSNIEITYHAPLFVENKEDIPGLIVHVNAIMTQYLL